VTDPLTGELILWRDQRGCWQGTPEALAAQRERDRLAGIEQRVLWDRWRAKVTTWRKGARR
jgi:hypothetical protein